MTAKTKAKGEVSTKTTKGGRSSFIHMVKGAGGRKGVAADSMRETRLSKLNNAKTLPPRQRVRVVAESEDVLLDEEIPEVTPEQIATAKRRGPERFAKGFPALPLETIRKGAGLTQTTVASASSMTQPEVARLEGRDTLEGVRIETLRRYVEGLGGKLELVATFPTGHRFGLAGAPRVEADER